MVVPVIAGDICELGRVSELLVHQLSQSHAISLLPCWGVLDRISTLLRKDSGINDKPWRSFRNIVQSHGYLDCALATRNYMNPWLISLQFYPVGTGIELLRVYCIVRIKSPACWFPPVFRDRYL